MTSQPEQLLENNLVKQLQMLSYKYVPIADESDLLANLKKQLEKHNGIEFTEKEFDKVLNILSKGSVFDKARTLRENSTSFGTMARISILNLSASITGVRIYFRSPIRLRLKVNTKTGMM